MEAPRQQAGHEQPASPRAIDTPPRPPAAGRDVVTDVRAARPRPLSLLERSNQELAEALSAFQQAVYRDTPLSAPDTMGPG